MTQQDVLDYIRKTPHNSNVNVVKGMLDSLGGSSLPEVTNEDNGKVLTVVEGEWDKAAGGVEPLIIRWNAENQRYDKTWQEVYDALSNARPCFALILHHDSDTEYGCELRSVVSAYARDGYCDVGMYVEGDNDLAEVVLLSADSANSYLVNS